MAVIVFFVDGLGLAPAGEANPLSCGSPLSPDVIPEPGLTAELFADLAEGETAAELGSVGGAPVVAARLDACLGVQGLPQSATGQTTLFTGVNAPRHLGRHLSGFPTPTLLKLLAEHSVFLRARQAGLTATFANPFPAGYFEAVATRRRRHATTTAAILAGSWPLRSLRDLREGRAVSFDVTGEALVERGFAVEPGTPEEGGRRLARLAREHDVVLFEYFLTDRYGHAQDMEGARQCFRVLDRCWRALLEQLDLERDTLLIVSDHGNVEDMSVGTHTRNPVPAIAIGPGAPLLGEARIHDLTGIAPLILRAAAPPRDGSQTAPLQAAGGEGPATEKRVSASGDAVAAAAGQGTGSRTGDGAGV